MGPGVRLIDSGEATAESLETVLRERAMAASPAMPRGIDSW